MRPLVRFFPILMVSLFQSNDTNRLLLLFAPAKGADRVKKKLCPISMHCARPVSSRPFAWFVWLSNILVIWLHWYQMRRANNYNLTLWNWIKFKSIWKLWTMQQKREFFPSHCKRGKAATTTKRVKTPPSERASKQASEFCILHAKAAFHLMSSMRARAHRWASYLRRLFNFSQAQSELASGRTHAHKLHKSALQCTHNDFTPLTWGTCWLLKLACRLLLRARSKKRLCRRVSSFVRGRLIQMSHSGRIGSISN